MPELRTGTRVVRGKGKHAILVVYPILALFLLTLYSLLTPTFYGSDEMAHAERALEIAHGEWVAKRAADGTTIAEFPDEVQPDEKALFTRPVTKEAPAYGSSLDSGFVTAAMLSTYPQRAFLQQYPRWKLRPNGRFPQRTMERLRSMRWSSRPIFVNFQNTAVYPVPLYVPAALAFGIGEQQNLTIVQTLFLSRMFQGICAVALGWIALRLAGPERLLLFCFLLLPVLLSFEASCSQDALLIPLLAVATSLLTRVMRENRHFRTGELAVMTLVLALAVCARPPYVWLLAVLALPSLEKPERSLQAWFRPAGAIAAALVLVGWWRFLIRASYISHAGVAYPPAQILFVKAHPWYTLYVQILRTFTNLPDLLVHGLLVLELRGAAATGIFFGVSLLTFAGIAVLCRKTVLRQTLSRVLLVLSMAAISLTISFVEYLIWNAPGSNQVNGVQARYYILLLPLLFLLSRRGSADRERTAVTDDSLRRRRPLMAAMVLYFAVAACTPFLLAYRYYDTNLFSALGYVAGLLVHAA